MINFGLNFNVLIILTVGRIYWTRDQPVATTLPKQDNKNTE
jgi:hypothetical protein